MCPVLWVHYKDFKDEKNYLALVNAKQSLGIEKVQTMIAEAIPNIVSEVMKTVSANGAGDRNKVEEIVNEKLQPVQDAVENVKNIYKYPFSSSASLGFDHFRMTATDIWMIVHRAAKPLTLEEIALQSQTAIPLTREALSSLIIWLDIGEKVDISRVARSTLK